MTESSGTSQSCRSGKNQTCHVNTHVIRYARACSADFDTDSYTPLVALALLLPILLHPPCVSIFTLSAASLLYVRHPRRTSSSRPPLRHPRHPYPPLPSPTVSPFTITVTPLYGRHSSEPCKPLVQLAARPFALEQPRMPNRAQFTHRPPTVSSIPFCSPTSSPFFAPVISRLISGDQRHSGLAHFRATMSRRTSPAARPGLSMLPTHHHRFSHLRLRELLTSPPSSDRQDDVICPNDIETAFASTPPLILLVERLDQVRHVDHCAARL